MAKTLLTEIKIDFECEDHQITETVDVYDLVESGVPICSKCGEDMDLVSDYAEVGY